MCGAADRITDTYWWHIMALGADLARRGEMSQQEIERFLLRATDSGNAGDKPALAACGATRAPDAPGTTNSAT